MRIAMLCSLLLAFSASAGDDEYAQQRAGMVQEVQRYATFARDDSGESFDKEVMRSLGEVQRHKFVPHGQRRHAYENRPLPIGHGQTISQPYIVALMTELIEPEADDVVLEVGTGSAYQAAILAKLVKHVYTIEIIRPLAEEAKKRLASLGYRNVTTKLGDGYYGWKERGPFDSIIVTAAASHVPPPLIKQLRPGGRMVIPVGDRFTTQQLLLITKQESGEVVTRQITAVRFVPLTGKH